MGEVIERIFISKDWITIILLMVITLLIFNKIRHPLKFNKLQTLLYSSNYFGGYSKSTPLLINVFNIIFIIIVIIVISLLLFVALANDNTDIMLFFKILIYVFSFVTVRFVIGFLLAVLFEKEKEQQYFTFLKLSYLSSFSILILPLLIVNFYINSPLFSQLLLIIAVLLLFYFFVLQIKNNQKFIFSKIFYFILYLCALEIAPYMIVYKLLIV